jgi:hypothetical protein
VPHEAAAQAGMRCRARYDLSPGTLNIGNPPALSGHLATRSERLVRDWTAPG